jgi:hypothetical protein
VLSHDIIVQQALDLSVLESQGNLCLKRLVLSSELPSDLDDYRSSLITWTDFQSWVDSDFQFKSLCGDVPYSAVSRYSVAIDDLEALDLCAPSARAARQALSSLCRHMDTTNKIQCVTAFGRQCVQDTSFSTGRWMPVSRDFSFSSSSMAGSEHMYTTQAALDEDDEPTLSEYLKYR